MRRNASRYSEMRANTASCTSCSAKVRTTGSANGRDPADRTRRERRKSVRLMGFLSCVYSTYFFPQTVTQEVLLLNRKFHLTYLGLFMRTIHLHLVLGKRFTARSLRGSTTRWRRKISRTIPLSTPLWRSTISALVSLPWRLSICDARATLTCKRTITPRPSLLTKLRCL